MIYTATKNGHTSTLIVEEGDLDAKNKLSKYRREGWYITASIPLEELILGLKDADPVPRVKEVIKREPAERRRRFTTILGHRVALE